jgi:hypothetical protein
MPSHQTSDKFHVFCVHSGSAIRWGQPGFGNLNLLPSRQHDADLHQLTVYFTDESAEESIQIHTVHKQSCSMLPMNTYTSTGTKQNAPTHSEKKEKGGGGSGERRGEANHLMPPSA